MRSRSARVRSLAIRRSSSNSQSVHGSLKDVRPHSEQWPRRAGGGNEKLLVENLDGSVGMTPRYVGLSSNVDAFPRRAASLAA